MVNSTAETAEKQTAALMQEPERKIRKYQHIDSKTEEILITCFENDATIEQACAIAGIAPSSYFAKCKKRDTFMIKMEKARALALIHAQKAVHKQITEKGDGRLALDFLKLRDERFKPAPQTSNTANILFTFSQFPTGNALEKSPPHPVDSLSKREEKEVIEAVVIEERKEERKEEGKGEEKNKEEMVL